MVPTGASLEAARARSGIEFQGKTMAATFETLLASDFSARCDRPLDRATQIQRDHGGTLTIAHVLKRERSEEHTSELQSLMRISYAVFCLKKKKTNTLLKEHLQHML